MSFRSVVAVIRHGDRTPKQKMKMEVRHPKFFELFDKYAGNKKGSMITVVEFRVIQATGSKYTLTDELYAKYVFIEIDLD